MNCWMIMRETEIILHTIIITFFINLLLIAALGDEVLKIKKRLKSNIETDKEFLKDVNEQVEKIEQERLDKRQKTKKYLYCFQCEAEMPVIENNGKFYCENCKLIHLK
ncbi:MAG: hypothetical protein K2P85_13475 [Flavobacteriaceae bacterium]|nr:hypothetical protein [Flavobacteriaceae bacterium]